MNRTTPAFVFVSLVTVASIPAIAQEEEQEETGWFNTTELSLVATDGKSRHQTVGCLETVFGSAELLKKELDSIFSASLVVDF